MDTYSGILRLAGPAIAEMALHTFVWILDTAMVGRLGGEALSAVGLGGQVYYTAIFVFAGIGVGATAMVARNVGTGQHRLASRVAAHALMLGVAGGAIVALGTAAFALPAYRLANLGGTVTAWGVEYTRIVSAGALALLPAIVGNAVLRGSGDTLTPLGLASIMNLVNVIGDYALIFGRFGLPAMGVKGAAVATAFAHVLGGVLVVGVLLAGRRGIRIWAGDLLRPEFHLLRRLIGLSVPAGVEVLLMDGARTVTQFLIAAYGTTAFAAVQVAVAAESLSFMPGYGFAIATSVLVGQYLGAREPQRAREGARRSANLALAVMGGMGAVFIAFPRAMVGLFTHDPAVVSAAAVLLLISGFTQPAIAVAEVLTGALRGAGDTRTPMYVTGLGAWVIRVPLTYAAVNLVGLPLAAAWLVVSADWFVRGLLLGRHFLLGRWQAVVV